MKIVKLLKIYVLLSLIIVFNLSQTVAGGNP